MQYLLDNELLQGEVLDFGCGKGFDAERLGIDSYDPHYKPTWPHACYDVITCNYVLNVIKNKWERDLVISNCLNLLYPDGVLYISIRNDKRNLNGYTKIGTWQGYIELPFEIVNKTAGYVLYRRLK
jgi:2-polyprenyl-3-methyl-5-hydroxy-6-metoxy-1,4-benzoquinol methylase